MCVLHYYLSINLTFLKTNFNTFPKKNFYQLRIVCQLKGDEFPKSVDVEGNRLELVAAHIQQTKILLEQLVGAEGQGPNFDLEIKVGIDLR